jgi:hypothetical protein
MKEYYTSNRRILLHDYLSDRRILTYYGDSVVRRNVHTEVPQGSFADSLLWNNVYDALDPVKNLDAVAVDDLAIVITMRKLEDTGDRVREAMRFFIEWCADTGHRLAKDRTEIILLIGKRVLKMYFFALLYRSFNFNINSEYLGVLWVNTKRCFPHLEQVCGKAKAFVGAIRNLLPNVNGPTGSNMKLYYGVWEPVVLHAAPICAFALSYQKNS